MTDNTQTATPGGIRYLIAAVLVVGAFFGAYRFAAARGADSSQAGAPSGVASATGGLGTADGGAAPGGAGCACCGSTAPTEGGITGEEVRGAATVAGDVQTLSVDLSKGYYEPNAIVLKAGVPAEITFGQSAGCTAQVMSQELGFFEDLSAGPRTVKLPALEKGEYPFYCGMQMVFGKIVVE